MKRIGVGSAEYRECYNLPDEVESGREEIRFEGASQSVYSPY
jgi:hypothetical protein